MWIIKLLLNSVFAKSTSIFITSSNAWSKLLEPTLIGLQMGDFVNFLWQYDIHTLRYMERQRSIWDHTSFNKARYLLDGRNKTTRSSLIVMFPLSFFLIVIVVIYNKDTCLSEIIRYTQHIRLGRTLDFQQNKNEKRS